MQMNDDYQKAINQTLESRTSGKSIRLSIVNNTNISLNMYLISPGGTDRWGFDDASSSFEPGAPPILLAVDSPQWLVTKADLDWYWLFTNAYSGAFAAVSQTPSNGTLSVTSFDLLDPNEIGGIPEPDSEVIIPTDSPRIVVGCGTLPNGNRVVREQYWHRLEDSYSIGPGETKTVSNTVTSGMQSTSSELSTVEGSISSSMQGGWGPVSASVSASLSAASTTFQQFTATSQSVSYVSDEYTNTGDKPQLYLYWQLTDSVSVYDRNSGLPLSTVVNATQPVVIAGSAESLLLSAPDRSSSAEGSSRIESR